MKQVFIVFFLLISFNSFSQIMFNGVKKSTNITDNEEKSNVEKKELNTFNLNVEGTDSAYYNPNREQNYDNGKVVVKIYDPETEAKIAAEQKRSKHTYSNERNTEDILSNSKNGNSEDNTPLEIEVVKKTKSTISFYDKKPRKFKPSKSPTNIIKDTIIAVQTTTAHTIEQKITSPAKTIIVPIEEKEIELPFESISAPAEEIKISDPNLPIQIVTEEKEIISIEDQYEIDTQKAIQELKKQQEELEKQKKEINSSIKPISISKEEKEIKLSTESVEIPSEEKEIISSEEQYEIDTQKAIQELKKQKKELENQKKLIIEKESTIQVDTIEESENRIDSSRKKLDTDIVISSDIKDSKFQSKNSSKSKKSKSKKKSQVKETIENY